MTTISFSHTTASSFFVRSPRPSISDRLVELRARYEARPHLLGALGAVAAAALAVAPFAALVYAFVAI